MKVLYIDGSMGVAGDMLLGALLDLFDEPEKIIEEMNDFGIPKVRYIYSRDKKCGICGSHVRVRIGETEEGEVGAASVHGHEAEGGHHEHRNVQDITQILDTLNISPQIKEDVAQVYRQIADAESRVHGMAVNQVHFHEVGQLDALADITAVCYLTRMLSPEKICASPVCTGYGQVKCAHGSLPVPAPATALLLQGIPSFAGTCEGERCTPTGAALLRYLADSYGQQPLMTVERTGYGTGTRDFPQANVVRIMLGSAEPDEQGDAAYAHEACATHIDDEVVELACNLDDMTAEEIGYVSALLLEQGALDVYSASIMMKKGRPGILLTCMCKREDTQRLLRIIFRHTTTLGIRERVCGRYTLARTSDVLETPEGEVHIKHARGYGAQRYKIEYEDLARIARAKGISLMEAREEIFTLRKPAADPQDI